ncbi:hypothetical protein ES703_82261 [subsurface metagenome]
MLNKLILWGDTHNIYDIINLRHSYLGVFLYLYIQVVVGVRANVRGDWNVNTPLARSKIHSRFGEVYAGLIMEDFVKAENSLVAYGSIEGS